MIGKRKVVFGFGPEHMEESLLFTSIKLQKCRRSRNFLSADHISELPDEILVVILSFLTMKEAARTSILSRRWKTLWTYYTGSLDLDGSKVFWEIKISKQYELLGAERVRYMRSVNQILNLHKGAPISAFRICFDLNFSFGSDIDSWINFAIQKKVKRLELDLGRIIIRWDDCYHFPLQSLDNPNIKYLTSLNLHYVDVTQEVVEYFLSNCPFLEFVRISVSSCLVGVNVLPESSPKLRCLEIVHCHRLEFLEIYAMDLTSFTYSGPKIRLCLKNVPKLAALSFGGLYCGYIIRKKNLRRLSISLSQIEELKLDLATEIYVSYPRFPTFKNLKQLELLVKATDRLPLLSYISLLKACPMLYRLSMQLEWLEEPKPRKVKVREKQGHPLKCLKVVELRWFRGSTTDVELATYLFTNSPSLEKISIDTRNPYAVGNPREELAQENVTAKERARQLTRELYPGAELQVL